MELVEFLTEVDNERSTSRFVVESVVNLAPTSASPNMRFVTKESMLAARKEMRKHVQERMKPVSIRSGKIHIQEKAMISEHPYEISLGDATFQFVKRTDGAVVMYELV